MPKKITIKIDDADAEFITAMVKNNGISQQNYVSDLIRTAVAMEKDTAAGKPSLDKHTISIRQFTTQSRGLKLCEEIDETVKARFGGKVGTAVNQLDFGVFQVELSGEFPRDIDLIF